MTSAKDKIWNILMVGVGGQGIILASDILAAAALAAGRDAKKSEIHGMSQRGGSVFSHIRFGDKIFSPAIPEGGADILLSLELMETLRWVSFAHRDTELIVLTEKILPANTESYPDGVAAEIAALAGRRLLLDPAELIAKIGDKKYVNVALCGVLAGRLDLPESAWQKAIETHVPAGTFDDNWKAFSVGRTIDSRL